MSPRGSFIFFSILGGHGTTLRLFIYIFPQRGLREYRRYVEVRKWFVKICEAGDTAY